MQEKTTYEKFDMACHNLSCYSANIAMTIPKPQWVKEWTEAKEEVNRLQEQLNLEKPLKLGAINFEIGIGEIAEETAHMRQVAAHDIPCSWCRETIFKGQEIFLDQKEEIICTQCNDEGKE